MKPRKSGNLFHQFFHVELNEQQMSNYLYKFFYFRTSPRGNSKFGVMDIPWQRLRNQQQGTDEEIQFDHIWIVRTLYDNRVIADIENELKSIYEGRCLASKNGRAGHTEWFSDVDINSFELYFQDLCKCNGVELMKLEHIVPYRATKRSFCPINAPVQYDRYWFDDFWTKQLNNRLFSCYNVEDELYN
jgi:hypothetical protein